MTTNDDKQVPGPENNRNGRDDNQRKERGAGLGRGAEGRHQGPAQPGAPGSGGPRDDPGGAAPQGGRLGSELDDPYGGSNYGGLQSSVTSDDARNRRPRGQPGHENRGGPRAPDSDSPSSLGNSGAHGGGGYGGSQTGYGGYENASKVGESSQGVTARHSGRRVTRGAPDGACEASVGAGDVGSGSIPGTDPQQASDSDGPVSADKP